MPEDELPITAAQTNTSGGVTHNSSPKQTTHSASNIHHTKPVLFRAIKSFILYVLWKQSIFNLKQVPVYVTPNVRPNRVFIY